MESKNKKTILIFVDWYLPGYKAGGPIKSISSLVNYLKNDFNFLIITSDTDFGESKPYPSLKCDTWIKIDTSTSVFYASKEFLNRKNILTLTKSIEFDLIYLNSFFSFYFSILPLFFCKRGIIRKPILIAPRGMLGTGALKLKSNKKKLFIMFSKFTCLHKHINWHATSEKESQEIRNVFGQKSDISMVPNLQYNEISHSPLILKKTEGELKLFFLSRISEKKNLLFALQLLQKINVNEHTKIQFDIYGPIEDKTYWQKCLEVINNLKSIGININYFGAIKNEEVADMIAKYHFLLLPTLNENYGHVIVESFVNGKPVIISDQTPWRDLENSNVGWDIALNNLSKFEKVINDCIEMENTKYEKMVVDTLKYSTLSCNSKNSLPSMKKMFNAAISNE